MSIRKLSEWEMRFSDGLRYAKAKFPGITLELQHYVAHGWAAAMREVRLTSQRQKRRTTKAGA